MKRKHRNLIFVVLASSIMVFSTLAPGAQAFAKGNSLGAASSASLTKVSKPSAFKALPKPTVTVMPVKGVAPKPISQSGSGTMTTLAVDTTPVDLNHTFDQAPFVISAAEDQVSTLTGSILLTKRELTLPGKNGLDFSLTRDYDSDSAQIFDVDFTKTTMPTRLKYNMKRSMLGPGWRWEIPSVEIDPTNTANKYVHLANGDEYQANFSSGTLINYPYKSAYKISSNSSGFILKSSKEGLTYSFDTAGKLITIQDNLGNSTTFSYGANKINALTYKQESTSTSEDEFPLIKVENSNGNSLSISYSEATATDPQKMVITSGNRTYTYKFTPVNVPTSDNGSTTKNVPVMTEADDPLYSTTNPTGHFMTYSYAINQGWSYMLDSSSVWHSTVNDYALVTAVGYPTNVQTNYAYNTFNKFLNGKTAKAVYTVKDVSDTYTDSQPHTANHLSLTYNGDLNSPLSDGTFGAVVTDDLKRTTTYAYAKDSRKDTSTTVPTPFFKLMKKTETYGDETRQTTYTYDPGTTKYPDPLTESIVTTTSTGSQTVSKSKAYDNYGSVTSEMNEEGREISYTYDTSHNSTLPEHWLLSKREYLKGSSTSTSGAQYQETTYDLTMNGTITSPNGLVYQMDVKDQSGSELQQEKYKYDSAKNMIEKDILDRNNRMYVTSYNYDGYGFPTLESTDVKDARERWTTVTKQYTFDPLLGVVKQYTDGNNQTISISYDSLGRPTKVTYADQSTDAIAYDDANNMITRTQSGGNGIVKQERNRWNPLGLKIEHDVYDNGGFKTLQTWEYDSYGRKTADAEWPKTDASKLSSSGVVTSYGFDLLDRVSSVTDPEGGAQTTSYDDAARTKTTTDADQHVTRETIDVMGRTVKSESLDASGSAVTLSTTSFDFEGNPITVTDSKGQSTNYQYDAQSHLTSVQDADGKTSYTYDWRGHIVQTTHPDGTSIQKQYDELGNLLYKTDEQGITEKYLYDGNGNNTFHYSKRAVMRYQYDARNRLIGKALGGAPGMMPTPIEVSYEYDAVGRRTKMTDRTGTTTYQYSSDDKLLQVIESDGTSVKYAYDNFGNRTDATDPFGLNVAYSYDLEHRMMAASSDNAGSLADATYAYTKGGHLSSVVTPVVQSSLSFDNMNRVTGLTQTKSSDATSVLNTYAYQYDGNGNETSKTENGTTNSYTYDVLNRVKTSSEFDETYSYDTRGNRKTLQSSKSVQLDESTYEYDGWNRLTKATTEDGKVVSYAYNGDDLLYERTENGVTTRYYYNDNNEVIADAIVTNGTPTLHAHYVRGENDHLVALIDANGNKSYYTLNGHSDVVDLRDSTGQVQNSYAYDLWGKPTTLNETVDNPFLYNGEFYDHTTGLQYLRARWYDPNVGRFLNEDTFEGDIKNPQSLNLYTYVSNNPLTFTDPTGHEEKAGMDASGTSGGAPISGAGMFDWLSNLADYVTELVENGVKVSKSKVVGIVRDVEGRIVWMEEGTDYSGLKHILDGKYKSFKNWGLENPSKSLLDMLMNAIKTQKPLGVVDDYSVFAAHINGVTKYFGIIIASNGYIVTARPIPIEELQKVLGW